MRAKFKCVKVVDFGTEKKAVLEAVISDENQENQDFNKYTPAGNLSMLIDQSGAMNYFDPGKSYYLDFCPAD